MRIKIFVFLSLIIALSAVNAQIVKGRSDNNDSERLSLPVFFYEIGTYPTLARDSVKLIIKTKVPFDAIQFIKSDTLFIARYELSIIILDENGNQSASKITSHKLETEIYDETNSKQLYDINEFTFKLLPAKYTVILSVLDEDTKKKEIQRDKIDTETIYKNSISLSYINIIDQTFTNEEGQTEEISSVGGSINDSKKDFSISFDILSEGGPAEISYRIFTTDGKEVLSKTMQDTLEKGICTRHYNINRDKLGYSKYKIIVEVSSGGEKATNERLFQLRWFGMSLLIDDLDNAIEQIKYIASNRDIKKIRKAGKKEKKEKFIEFWKKLDPTPGTPENELMNEYYRRVRYANLHFSGFMEGWKTDMGMIFILFGPPNDIERHPFELDSKPYEIWYYQEINRTFVFIDETGFGDYRLTEPYYENIFRY